MKPTCLYRCYDSADTLLYVGMAYNAMVRLGEHRNSPWFEHVATIRIERFPTRQEARDAEREAIREENPLHNGNRYKHPAPSSLRDMRPCIRFRIPEAIDATIDAMAREMGCYPYHVIEATLQAVTDAWKAKRAT